MYNYYFKIKKNNVEFEFSTDDVKIFDKKVINWVKNICDNEKNLIKKSFIDVNTLIAEKEEENQEYEQDFEKVLHEQLKTDTSNIKEKNIVDFELKNYLNEKMPSDIFQIFMCVAYYFSNRLHEQAFTLKQINIKLFPIMQTVVTHQTIKDSLDNKFIEIIPDLTGLSNSTRYSITVEGEEYVNKGF